MQEPNNSYDPTTANEPDLHYSHVSHVPFTSYEDRVMAGEFSERQLQLLRNKLVETQQTMLKLEPDFSTPDGGEVQYKYRMAQFQGYCDALRDLIFGVEDATQLKAAKAQYLAQQQTQD